MIKRINPFSLVALLAFLTFLFSSVQSVHFVQLLASEPRDSSTRKTIYIDLSLSETFSSPQATCYVSYTKGGAEERLFLTEVDNDIYSVELPLDIVKEADKGFSINCSLLAESQEVENPSDLVVYSTALIKGNTELQKDNCNYVALAEDAEAELALIEGFGYYGARTANPGSTYVSQRVWLAGARNEERERPFGESNAVGFFDAEKRWHIIDMIAAINAANNTVYYYADIPYECTSFSFLRIANEESHNYCVYANYEISPINYGGCYSLNDGEIDIFTVENADANLLALVVESYLSYGTAPSNGSVNSTISNLFITWFDKSLADAASLKNVKILDYSGYTANGNSYEGLEKQSSFSVSEKWETLCSRAGIDPKTGKTKSLVPSFSGISKSTLLFLMCGIGGFAVLLILAAFFIRRHNNAR